MHRLKFKLMMNISELTFTNKQPKRELYDKGRELDKSHAVQAPAKTKELEEWQSANKKTMQELHTKILGNDARINVMQELHNSAIIKMNKELQNIGVTMHADRKKSNVAITIDSNAFLLFGLLFYSCCFVLFIFILQRTSSLQ